MLKTKCMAVPMVLYWNSLASLTQTGSLTANLTKLTHKLADPISASGDQQRANWY